MLRLYQVIIKTLTASIHRLTTGTAMNMLNEGVKPEKTKTVVEYSSGSTVVSLALASRIFHHVQDVRAFLSNKTTAPKLRLMQFFGLDM
jgi:cysteine synthase